MLGAVMPCLLLLLAACSGDTGDAPPPPLGGTTDSATSSGGSCEEACGEPSSATGVQTLSELVYDRGRTADNALKGFLTSYLWSEPIAALPDQLEFIYLPMKDVWDASGATLEAGLEPLLEAAADRDHHAIVRVYIDYPAKESGLPDYLTETVSCQVYEDYGGGCSPDYADEDLLEAMTGLIAALGEAYDGDPRLGFVQLGLLGFWGEWHTYPHTDWFPDEAIQDTVLAAYEAAFPTTQLQVRRPAASSLDRRIGFHDDSFAYSTIGETSWFFWTEIEALGGGDRWEEVPIGGELRPELQDEVFRDDYETGEYAQDLDACIDQTHASYLLNYVGFSGGGTGYVGEELERAQEAALRMGYEFQLEAASLTASELLDGEVEATLSLTIRQTGVAPFYYPLDVELGGAFLEAPVSAGEDLSTLLPGDSRTVTVALGRVPVGRLSESLELSLSSPMLGEGQAVRFATASPEVSAGDVALSWTFSCEQGDSAVELGTVVGVTAQGCDCVCDVDGQLRGCDGEPCEG